MGKRPIVYTTGPSHQDRHCIDAVEFSRTIRVSATYKKGCGDNMQETFRRQMQEMVDTIIVLDRSQVKVAENPTERMPAESDKMARNALHHALASPIEIGWPEPMHRIEPVWETGSTFLEGVIEAQGCFFFFIPLEQGAEASSFREGERLSVTIRFGDYDMGFRLHTVVVECSTQGLQVRVSDMDRGRIVKALAYARGEQVDYVRRAHERVACFFPLQLAITKADTADAVATDISTGGVRVGLMKPSLVAGTLTQATFDRTREVEPFTVRGRIAYVESSNWPLAAGVQFLYGSQEEEDSVLQMIELARAA